MLLTDGKDEGSPRSEEDVLGRIKGTQIPIYTLGFGPQAQVDYHKKVSAARIVSLPAPSVIFSPFGVNS